MAAPSRRRSSDGDCIWGNRDVFFFLAIKTLGNKTTGRTGKKKKEAERRELELLQIRGTLAAMSLGEATATALKNGHCNGETERALDYETKVKHEIRDFLARIGVNHTT